MTTDMTTVTDSRARDAVDVHAVSGLRVLRSEWIKLRSLRSTPVLLGLTIVGMLAVSLALAVFIKTNYATLGAADHRPDNLVDHSMFSFNLAQLIIGVFGVLAITGEYSTGMIRATLGAVPTRLPVLWAKAGIVTLVALAVALVASFGAFLASQAVLGSHGTSLSYPGALRAVFGVALYLTVVALLGLALGFLTRSTAGGIAAVVGLLLVLPAITAAFPTSVANGVDPYLPPNAGQALLTLGAGENPMLHPWAGFGLFVGYAGVALIAAAIVLHRRDA